MGAEDGARKRVRGSGGAGASEGDDACVPSAGEELEALQRLLAEERARSASLSAELDALRSSAAGCVPRRARGARCGAARGAHAPKAGVALLELQ